MAIRVLKNCLIFDGIDEKLIENGSIVIEDGRIREVCCGDVKIASADSVDCGGQFVMPGLLDIHFHAYGASLNLQKLDQMPMPVKVAFASKFLQATLQRGFTTVRDPAGGDVGLHLAINQGLIDGPRYFYGGKGMSQTGGHGDMRPEDVEAPCGCAPSHALTAVVDGVDDVRRFCRNELRKGADHIKVFISGGVTSPTDPIWMNQYTTEELEAAVYEAETRRKYVVAHCHTDEGARRCLEVGIRSIDHCTVISEETAALIQKAEGTTYAVPTLAILELMVSRGAELGMSDASLAKASDVHEGALRSLEYLTRCNARFGMGTDLIGETLHPLQNMEFSLRAEVVKPVDQLRSATSINAEIIQKSDILGSIKPGAHADIVVINRNPLDDIHVMSAPDKHFVAIVKGGEFIRNEL